jgi:hypothetical protein
MRLSFPEHEPTELCEGDERGKVAGVSVGASKSWDRIGGASPRGRIGANVESNPRPQ